MDNHCVASYIFNHKVIKILFDITKISLSLPCFLKTQSLIDAETQSYDDKSFATLRLLVSIENELNLLYN